MRNSTIASFLLASLIAAGLSHDASAQGASLRGQIEQVVADYLAEHPEQVEMIVKNYLAKNPQVLNQAFGEALKRNVPVAAVAPTVERKPPTAQVVSDPNLVKLVASPHQVVLGNANGKTTMVEFFDYNCGYCKRALGDMLSLLKDDPDLRIVLKEFPILGPGSSEAAKVAVAVRMQDPTGVKYLKFHQRLMSMPGYVDRAKAMTAATEAGIDGAQLAQDIESAEIATTISESMQLAQALGINGTPSYVINGNVIRGAVGEAGLREQLRLAAR